MQNSFFKQLQINLKIFNVQGNFVFAQKANILDTEDLNLFSQEKLIFLFKLIEFEL